MVINRSVQYNGGFLPDIILLTQSNYHRGTPVKYHVADLYLQPTVCRNNILLLPCVMVYNIVSVLFLLFFWCPCIAINVSVRYNGGLLPDMILLTQYYFHRGTRLNVMNRFCICSL